ncbi:MAG TPA: hypothetical protein VHD90_00410 [Phototrophicaceae bacterium]|nr:hypothetical protein [Phototrophicaceae bacterium]
MLRLAIPALLLTAIFSLALGACHLQQANSSVKAYFGDCTLPCWQGITPGLTSTNAAMAQFNAASSSAPLHYPCSSPPALVCDRYLWAQSGNPALNVEMEVVYGEIGEIAAFAPPFTLGEVILMMEAEHKPVIGAYPSYAAGNQFYAQVLFGDTHLSVQVIAACSGTYLDLMQTPVSDVIVESPGARQHNVPVTSFASVRQQFERVCGS